MSKEQLLARIHNRDLTLAVVGLGYVGLPLAVEFAQAGLKVVGIDVSADKVAALNRGESYIPDVPSAMNKTRDPDMSYVIDAAGHVAEQAHPGFLIVLESTTYPGTTEEILLP